MNNAMMTSQRTELIAASTNDPRLSAFRIGGAAAMAMIDMTTKRMPQKVKVSVRALSLMKLRFSSS